MLEHESEERDDKIGEKLAGDLRWRTVGIGALLIGVALTTAGGIVGAFS